MNGVAAADQEPRGRRAQTKAANRAAILASARAVFVELGFGAASVRDIVRGTDLAAGTFYNYFPDKEAVLRAIVDEAAAEVRVEVQVARRAATDLETFLGSSFRAYLAHLASDRELFHLMRRNAGTITALLAESAIGASVEELSEDLRTAVATGLAAEHDTPRMAHAIVGSALEIAAHMVEQDEPDVEGAVVFLTGLFLAALRPVAA